MKLHTCFITYNRLELTKQAISSYLETVSVPCTFVVVDNGSEDGTSLWLMRENFENLILLDENHYPGYACNRGWELAPDDATHLHRADNDFLFLPGWCDEVEAKFRKSHIGQVGLRTAKEERFALNNVGGNCVIDRKLWDKGLRYDERPWPEFPYKESEDTPMSRDVRRMGYQWTRVRKPCIRSISREDPNDPYYQKSWRDRGIIE